LGRGSRFDLSATTHTVPVDREYCDILNAAAGFGCTLDFLI